MLPTNPTSAGQYLIQKVRDCAYDGVNPFTTLRALVQEVLQRPNRDEILDTAIRYAMSLREARRTLPADVFSDHMAGSFVAFIRGKQ